MRAPVFELNTSISNLRDLRASDLGPYDAVYLGNIYCRLYEANLLERPADLQDAFRIVRDQGKRAYLTTYAAPRNDVLPRIRQALEVAAAHGADAVEVHNLGVLKIVFGWPLQLAALGSMVWLLARNRTPVTAAPATP